LIWHIDESQTSNSHENYPGCSGCSGHYWVSLEQADNKWDLEKNVNRGDAGDSFPGVCNGGACNTSFTATTAPNSNLWSGLASGVTITAISASASTMTATLSPTVASVPSLSISKTHSGNFTQGQPNALYTLRVTNAAGAGPTSGTVTVTENAPSGLSFVSMSGSAWNCNGNNCSRGDSLNANSSYPDITVTVNVLPNATTPQVNAASVTGGGSADANATDPTTVVQLPDLTIAKTHTGDFLQGQTGATYAITVTNIGLGATSGQVTVSDNVPSGLTATAIAGSGWICTQPSGPCHRTDALASAGSYLPITLTVNVGASAPGTVTNTATVSGGGEIITGNDIATDPTTITPKKAFRIGTFNAGLWKLDVDGSGTFDAGNDKSFALGFSGATVVLGDWNGDGRTKVGVYSNGYWYLDYNGDGVWDGGVQDKLVAWGWSGCTPVVGDWNGNGKTKIGVYSNGFWFLDYNGDFLWDGGVQDKQIGWGWAGVTPVVGDWNGNGKTKIGVYSNGFWFLDYNGDFLWDGGVQDKQIGWGWAGVTPIVGDWNGDGKTKIGVYAGGYWYIDYDGNYLWEYPAKDKIYQMGWTGTTMVMGDWNGDGKTKTGAFINGYWYLDYNGNGVFDGSGTDRIYAFGATGDTPVVGKW
jgi:uncharacterized repeat protein (TIGR01451 family)